MTKKRSLADKKSLEREISKTMFSDISTEALEMISR
jgi:hypothetical protein